MAFQRSAVGIGVHASSPLQRESDVRSLNGELAARCDKEATDLSTSRPPQTIGPAMAGAAGSPGRRQNSCSVKPMKMMDRPVAVADTDPIGRGDRGADPGLGIANRGFQLLAPGKARRNG